MSSLYSKKEDTYYRNMDLSGREFAEIMKNTPACADQSAAIRKIREAEDGSGE